MAQRTSTDYIVVHCAATPPEMDIGAADIDRWHKERGWRGIGYHAVIRRDGTIEEGRPLNEQGAHAAGYNNRSVAVCLIGGVDAQGEPENNFTLEQLAALETVLKEWRLDFPKAEIVGHRDLPGVKKVCPSFDVSSWWTQAQSRKE